MMMAHWLEDLTKTIADDKLPRRQAMRRIAGGVAGVALASWLPDQALAKNLSRKKQCSFGGSCEIGYPGCPYNLNCICFTGAPGAPAAFCGCDGYCSQMPTCKRQRHCPRGTVCSTLNGCKWLFQWHENGNTYPRRSNAGVAVVAVWLGSLNDCHNMM